MDLEPSIRSYKDRIRIFLILYIFSEPLNDSSQPNVVKVFRTETRLQKIDFLIRNPDYLSSELLTLAKENPLLRDDIKKVVKSIFQNQEPSFRRLEMERFFFGAYEDIDDVVSFLKSIGFIKFSSKKSSDFKTIDKQYFITDIAEEKFKNSINQLSTLKWYVERCELIKKYFGDLSATQLKVAQYQIAEYRNTSYKQFIGDIEQSVQNEFLNLYSEAL